MSACVTRYNENMATTLSEDEKTILRYMIDLEDRGSEWPPARRIVTGTAIGSLRVEALLSTLAFRGFVAAHLNLDEDPRYSVTSSGRQTLFKGGS